MEVTLLGISMDVLFLHILNAFSPIVVVVLGKTTDVKVLQERNRLVPITLFEVLNFSR